MRNRMHWMLGLVLCLLCCGAAKAQYGAERWEVAPFVGYETSGTYPFSPISPLVTVNSLRIDGATSFGTFIDYSVTHNAQLEFMWDRNNSSYSEQQFPGGAFTKAYDSHVDQYQFGGLYMLLGREHRIRPYIAGSVGFTHEYNSGMTPNRTDFGFSVGGGVKYELTRHLALRGDARYMPTYANSGLSQYCDPFFGCYTARVPQYQNRGNFVGGIVIRF
jgi:hypothetical protein